MTETYTFTARHALDPEKIITLTLRGEFLQINLTGMLENIGGFLGEESRGEALKSQVKKQARPTMLKVMEEISGPIHISDVKGKVVGRDADKLKITLWKRVGGLRAAPIQLNFGKVDNPQAAKAFIEQLDKRREEADHVGPFWGPLDYWLGWFVMVFAVIILWKWPPRKGKQSGS